MAHAAPAEALSIVAVGAEVGQLSEAHQVICCSEVYNLYDRFTSHIVVSDDEEELLEPTLRCVKTL